MQDTKEHERREWELHRKVPSNTSRSKWETHSPPYNLRHCDRGCTGFSHSIRPTLDQLCSSLGGYRQTRIASTACHSMQSEPGVREGGAEMHSSVYSLPQFLQLRFLDRRQNTKVSKTACKVWIYIYHRFHCHGLGLLGRISSP